MITRKPQTSRSALYSVDLFCGAGGLSLGLKRAGFDSLYAADWDKWSSKTYEHNFPNKLIEQRDVAKISIDEIRSRLGNRQRDVALVCGGPPCQGFSIQRRGARRDQRNDLVLDFARLAAAINPPMILMENVPGLLGLRGRSIWNKFRRILESAGYTIQSAVLDAADYGVPQFRRRAIVVAWNFPASVPFEFPAKLSSEPNWATVRDAIGNLPPPAEDFRAHGRFANHLKVKITEVNQLRISHVPEGGGRKDIPAALQLPCHRNNLTHRHLDVFGRMRWDTPAPTITAMFDNFTRGRFAHPEQDRSITGREGARLQSFPDSFRFLGPKKDVARQIGNAVPPRLAEVIGRSLSRWYFSAQSASEPQRSITSLR